MVVDSSNRRVDPGARVCHAAPSWANAGCAADARGIGRLPGIASQCGRQTIGAL